MNRDPHPAVVTLTATSTQHGSQQVDAHVSHAENELKYCVVRPGEPLSDDFYFAGLRRVGTDVWQVVALNAHRADLKGIGIGPAVLLDAKRRVAGRVVSSPRDGGGGVFRSSSATAMWERMVAHGNAVYHEATDEYEVT